MTESTRRILITGASGQLGRELLRSSPPGIQCIATSHSDLDITDRHLVDTVVTSQRPWAIINTAAYTAVDDAEAEANRAAAVNTEGARILAIAAARSRCRLVHISTDYVFGTSAGAPLRPSDTPTPRGVYARTKEQGERAVQDALPRALILRTGWLYSIYGDNFVRKMLALMRSHGSVRVATDQVGTPTWGFGLANAIWQALGSGLHGIHHWTDAGVASWYDFAMAVAEEASTVGLLKRAPIVTPINTAAGAATAPRPTYSVLDKEATWEALQMRPPHWRVQLRLMLKELRAAGECTGDA